MKKELEESLIKDFDHILRGRNEGMKHNLMCFGFEYEDGWYSITREFLEKVKEIDPNVKMLQAKEKFGGLRLYIESSNDKVYDLEEEYENKSYDICETCGSPGKLRTDIGWHKTTCPVHYVEKLEAHQERQKEFEKEYKELVEKHPLSKEEVMALFKKWTDNKNWSLYNPFPGKYEIFYEMRKKNVK